MPPLTGQYSKGIKGGFNEAERLQIGLVRPGIAWIDADENRKEFMRYTWIRRALETVIGNASPNDGFRCVGDSGANDFVIEGGDGTLNGAGRMWIAGHHGFLQGDIRYVNDGSTLDELAILPEITQITGASNEVLEDTSADFVVDSLIGRTVVPDVAQVTVVTVVSNTARTITTDTDLVAAGIATGARYSINTSTPVGSGRVDGVYLNVALDEVDGVELPSINHELGTSITAQFFAKSRFVVEIHHGDTPGLPGALSDNYIDADGFEHFRIKIAEITRFDGQDAIDASDVVDLRVTSANFSTFMRKTGDTMTGDLILSVANIVMLGGETVDGRDLSVDGAKLDTIDFTAAGIASLLPLITSPVRGTDLVAVATTQTSVGEFLRIRTPGGTVSVKGVFTTPPENRVRIQDSSTLDDFLGGTDAAQKVFARLTELHPFPTLTGTWTFSNAGFGVSGSGGDAVTELSDGDIVQGPDTLFYTVNGAPSGPNDFLLKEPFGGSTAATANPVARRFLLDLVMNDEGVETAFTPTAPIGIRWHFEEVFDASDRPVINPVATVQEDQVAALVPDATETVKGIAVLPPAIVDAAEGVKGLAEFAPSLNTDVLKAVQGSDTRLAQPIQAQDSGGSPIGGRYTHIREGANVTFNDIGGGVLEVVASDAVIPDADTMEEIIITLKVLGVSAISPAGGPYNVFTNHVSGVMKLSDDTFVTSTAQCRFHVAIVGALHPEPVHTALLKISSVGSLTWDSGAPVATSLYAVVTVHAKKVWRNAAVDVGSLVEA